MNKEQSICWDCANYYADCSWSRSFKPVEGWDATPKRYYNANYTNEELSYCVHKCPEFQRDARGLERVQKEGGPSG